MLLGTFNQEKALIGAFSVIVKTGCGTECIVLQHYFLQTEGMNGNCVKFEKEILRQKPRGDEYKMQGVPLQYPLDTMSVNSEIA